MTLRSRSAALALAAALALTACTSAESTAGTPANSAVRTSDPDAPLTVIAEATDREASVAASRELFDASPVVLLAPSGDPEAQELGARAAIGLGVPLLVAPAADTAGKTSSPSPAASPRADQDAGRALSAEIHRLNTSTVVVVGDVAPLAEEEGDTGVSVERVDATAAAVSEATGAELGKPTAADPGGFAAGIAAVEPAAGKDGAIKQPTRAKPLTDTFTLAVDGVTQLAPIATARAAGVPVHLVPETSPNPQGQASAIDALHASATTKTVAIGAAFGSEPALEWKIRSARSGVKLPGGGQLLFPQHQFIALYGTPSTSVLGVLGEQDAAGAVQRARDVAAQYVPLSDKTVVPMFEIIATVAAGGPGKDGNYSNELSVDGLRPWVDAAAAAGIYVVIDLQPGRTDFLTQAKQYQSLLELPNVGLALDPEWRLGPDQVPLKQIGSVSAAEVNTVTTWLADLTNAKGLPQKMLVLHQFRPAMISDRPSLDLSRPEVAVLIHADGQGGQGDKQATWANLHRDAPAGVWWGWKNFHDEDLPMLTPEQTMSGVSPAPDLVTYQ